MVYHWTAKTLTLWLQLTSWGVEKNGTVNHLLETEHKKNIQYSISISTPEHLPIKKPFTWFLARIEMECQMVWGIDEYKDMEYEASRKKYICNASDIKIIEGSERD